MSCLRWCLAAASIAFTSVCARAETPAVHLSGSLSLLPAAQRIAEAYMARNSGAIILVRGGDSGPGLKALLDGTADIAMISAAIPADVTKRAKALSIAMVSKAVALDAIVPAVNKANPVVSLSRTQLTDLYRGDIGSWTQLGAGQGKVTLLAQPPFSGTSSAWRAAILGEELQTPRATLASTAQMKQLLATDPSAIGYMSLGAVDPSIKAIAVDGVAGTRQTIQNGTYPLRREMSLVIDAKAGPAVTTFVAFFLSAEGQKLVADSGLLPVQGAE